MISGATSPRRDKGQGGAAIYCWATACAGRLSTSLRLSFRLCFLYLPFAPRQTVRRFGYFPPHTGSTSLSSPMMPSSGPSRQALVDGGSNRRASAAPVVILICIARQTEGLAAWSSVKFDAMFTGTAWCRLYAAHDSPVPKPCTELHISPVSFFFFGLSPLHRTARHGGRWPTSGVKDLCREAGESKQARARRERVRGPCCVQPLPVVLHGRQRLDRFAQASLPPPFPSQRFSAPPTERATGKETGRNEQ